MTTAPLGPEKVRASFLAAMDSTQGIVEAVTAGEWSRATPCDEWDVRDVVNHLVYENLWAVELFNGKTIAEVGDALEGDLVGDAPREKYVESAAAVRKIIEQPDSMSVTCHISSGPVPGSEYASQLFLDTLIHGWDIAVGAGQSGVLPADLVEACMPLALMVRDAVPDSGPFSSEVQTADSVDPQTKLLAILGRNADEWKN